MYRYQGTDHMTQKLEHGDSFHEIRIVSEYMPKVDSVFDTLKNAIRTGSLNPGQRLIEEEVSEMVKTSRIPVREALKKLEEYGLVEKLPVRGYAVRNIKVKDIEEVRDILSVLESHAACAAMERSGDEFMTSLEKNIADSFRSLRKGNVEMTLELIEGFHGILYGATGNKTLQKMIGMPMEYITWCRRMFCASKESMLVSLEYHRKILELINRRDKKALRRFVRMNVLKEKRFMLAKARSRCTVQADPSPATVGPCLPGKDP